MPDRKRTARHRPSRQAMPEAESGRKVSLGVLGGFLGYALRRAQLAMFANFTQLLGRFQLKPGDFGTLIVIDANPGLRSTDVCLALGFQKANFAPLLRRLESRGLVRRVAFREDRRAQSLQLTAAGRRLLATALQMHKEHERALSAGLEPQVLCDLVAMLDRVTRFCETENRC